MAYTLDCRCVPDASGYGYCSECTRKLREKIWRNLTPGERRYDRQFAPAISQELDNSVYGGEEPTGCSCHINPPCSYCVDKNNEDEE